MCGQVGEDKLCVSKVCVSKLCDDKICDDKMCEDKVCVSKLCVEEAAGGGRRRRDTEPKTREPHTKMWGTPTTFRSISGFALSSVIHNNQPLL